MKKSIILGAVAALALGGVAVAQPTAPGDRGMRADTDGDGRISRAEWVEARRAGFVRLDANRDGTLTAEERKAGRESMRQERLQRRFAAIDANSDGSVSLAEFTAARQDRDGRRGERHGMRDGRRHDGHHMRQGRRGFRNGMRGVQVHTLGEVEARAAAAFARLDADNDGYVTQAERRAKMERRHGGRHGGRHGTPAAQAD